MKKYTINSRSIVLAVSLLLFFSAVPSVSLTRAESTDSVVLKFDFPSPVVTEGPVYDSVTTPGLPQYGAPGEPILPFRAVKALIPQGKDVRSVDVITGNKKVLEGRFNVDYGKTPIPISSNITVVDQPDQMIYSSADPFPGVLFSQMSEHYLRGYKIFMLKLHPVQYVPKTCELFYFETMTVTIGIKEIGTVSPLIRNLPQDRALVSSIVDNPDKVKTYTETARSMQLTTLVDPSYSYDYVVITNNVLKSSFEPLVDWKIQKGLNANIVLLEDIMNDPDYYCDGLFGDGYGTQFNETQAHVRNFIKDAYMNWGTNYVLLGGDDEIIPTRGVYVYAGRYTDYNIPCDMYYGALDGSWDNDNDTIFGEAVYFWSGPENGTEGEEADFFAEVYIGRATVDTAEEATNFVDKTLAYEQNLDAGYLKKAMMIGETLDTKTEGGNGKDLVTDIIPQYTTTRLYERDGTFSSSAVINEMNSGTHIVNHYGHAGSWMVMGLGRSHVDSLINTEYFVAYSIGCYSAAFDEATSGPPEAIAEHFIFNSHGAFAYIGNSRYGWYLPGSTKGPGELYDRSFFRVLNSGVRNLGKALQLSKEQEPCFHRWTYFTINLLGDPEAEIVTDITSPTAHLETRTDLLTPPRYEGIVSLNGTATRGPGVSATFDNYTIEFGLGTNPTSWSSMGISLTNNGKSEVVNAPLATWDTSLVSNGTYTLRLTVSDVDGNVGEDWAVIIVQNPILEVFHDFTEFNKLVIRPLSVINFDDTPSDTSLGNPATIDGVTFTHSVATSIFKTCDDPLVFSPVSPPNVLAPFRPDGTLEFGLTTLTFRPGTGAAGLYLVVVKGHSSDVFMTSTVTAVDSEGNSLTVPVTFQGEVGEQRFIAFSSPFGIRSISFRVASRPRVFSVVSIDDVSYAWHPIETCDEDGYYEDKFYPGEYVYVRGSFLSPSSDIAIYIVADGGLPVAVAHATTEADGTLPVTLLWDAPYYGGYDIWVDMNQNGLYDDGDLWMEQALNVYVFFVIPELPMGTATALLLMFAALTLFQKRSVIRR